MRGEEKRIPTPARRIQVTERDKYVFTWMSEQYALSFDQLQHLLGHHAKGRTTSETLSLSATRNAVTRWQSLGFVETRKIITGHTPYIWLSRKGLSSLGIAYPYYEPRAGTAAHIYSVNNVRLHMHVHASHYRWLSERAQRLELIGLKDQEKHPHIPDAELLLPGEPPIAVEVVETAPHLHTLIQHAFDLAAQYRTVWYFLHPSVLETMIEVFATLEPQEQARLVYHDLLTMNAIPYDRIAV